MREFALPDLGEGIAEAELVRWLVEEGDRVSEDQPIAEVETDKALVELPSPVAGTVSDQRVDPGEIVPVGTVIVVFDEADADAAADPLDAAEPAPADRERSSGAQDQSERDPVSDPPAGAVDAEHRIFAPPRVRRLARELGVDLAALARSGTAGEMTEADVRAAATDQRSPAASEPDPDHPDSGTPPPETERSDEPPATPTPADRDRTLAAPATRGLARELDVDLDAVPASGERDGEAVVTAEDVRRFAGSSERQRASQERATAGDVIPYRGVRRSVGQQMVRSAFTAPHVTHHDTVRVDRLVDARRALADRAERHGVNLTYLPFVLKAVAMGLEEFPILNATLDESAEEIGLRGRYDIGVAVATDDGLLVPVVEAADEKGLFELAGEIESLTRRARDRTITREEMQGGTFTVTNFGAVGGEYATPIINHPEVAILGLGSIVERPWVIDGAVTASHTLPLSLSIDHRVVDGAVAARFVNRLKDLLHEPILVLE